MADKTEYLIHSRQMIVDLKVRIAKEREYIVKCAHQFFIVTDCGNRCLVCKEEAK